MQDFDEALRPQDDFFGYVNNNWIKNNPIPATESVWGTFYILDDQATTSIKQIVDEITKTTDDNLSHDQKLIKTFFTTSMNYSNYRNNHIKTISDEIQKINKITSKSDLAGYLGQSHRAGVNSFWSGYVSTDDKNSQIQVLCFHQGGLSLPNRDYYLDSTERMKNIRLEFKSFFQKISQSLPEISIGELDSILNIEMELAKASWSNVKLRDVEKNYNRFTVNELTSRFESFNWSNYFKEMNWENPNDNIVIGQMSFMDTALNIINTKPLNEIKDYLKWQTLNERMSWIDETITQIKFDFYGRVIGGKTENKPLWKRSSALANSLIISETLGQEYATRFFPESSKKAVLEIVEDIRTAYHSRIDKVTWMKEKTKQQAHKKLDNTKVLIGYPSIWHDLSKLSFSSDNQLQNIIDADIYASDIMIKKIGQKPNHEDWHMNAHTVNAYYDPNLLIICFPAGILQKPFYDPSASYATNLGGIGAIIGHELTHGFDDQGSEFDEYGNVKKWQSKAEKAEFKKLSQSIIKQADEFEAAPGIFLSGNLILGEAIADIGGIELAIEALRIKNIKDKQSIRELFVNAATAERESQREENAIKQAKIDPHPPSKFRINCVFNHIDAFYEAYDVKPSDNMYIAPELRAKIW